MVKRRKLFSSSDSWSHGADLFPIVKIVEERIFVQKKCFLRLKCMRKSCENCVLRLGKSRLLNIKVTFFIETDNILRKIFSFRKIFVSTFSYTDTVKTTLV